jgi:hypothetical protein
MSNRQSENQFRNSLCLLLLSCIGSLTGAWAGEAVQPGFYYHDPADTGLQLKAMRSGAVCSDADGRASVCETAIKIVITGKESCESSPATIYPCTRFGYQFDYQGAAPGTAIACTVQRTGPMGRRSSQQYNHELSADSGSVFYPTYRTFAAVEKRTILSEVHECTYRGERLSSIEFIIYYEPESSSAPADGGQTADQYFQEVPNACASPHLTEATALGLLGAERVQPSAASEHIPTFTSQCIYSARSGTARQVGFNYKFMLSEMFDVDTVEMQQLQFNATFASGGTALKETRRDIGDLAFIFDERDRSSLLVITGIKGPRSFPDRPTEFIANYFIKHPELTPEQRQGLLIEEALRDLKEWRSSQP